jgi:hypothetical protein
MILIECILDLGNIVFLKHLGNPINFAFPVYLRLRDLLADLGSESSHKFSVVVEASQMYPCFHFEQLHQCKVVLTPGMQVPGKVSSLI